MNDIYRDAVFEAAREFHNAILRKDEAAETEAKAKLIRAVETWEDWASEQYWESNTREHEQD